MSTPEDDTYEAANDATKFRPTMDDLMKGLQDEGVVDPKSKAKTLKYKTLEKFATRLYKKWKAESFPNLPTNQTRGKDAIVKVFLRIRKHVDCSEVHQSLRKYGKKEKVFIVQNDSEHGGITVVIANLQNYWYETKNKHKDNRTPEDAIRVAAAMLQQKHRGSVQGIMSGKKDRAKQDQAQDPTDAFFVEIQDDFEDSQFVVPRPEGLRHIIKDVSEDITDKDVNKHDPNSANIIAKSHEKDFAKLVWQQYLKPKYKRAMRLWGKQTGNGSKLTSNFPNYCDGDRWLLWIYLLDKKEGLLLASGAGGTVQNWMKNESGFSGQLNGTDSNPSTKRKESARVEATLFELEKQKEQVAGLIVQTSAFLKKKEQEEDESKLDKLLDSFEKQGEHRTRVHEATDISPSSKTMMLRAIKKRRVDLSHAVKTTLKIHDDDADSDDDSDINARKSSSPREVDDDDDDDSILVA